MSTLWENKIEFQVCDFAHCEMWLIKSVNFKEAHIENHLTCLMHLTETSNC